MAERDDSREEKTPRVTYAIGPAGSPLINRQQTIAETYVVTTAAGTRSHTDSAPMHYPPVADIQRYLRELPFSIENTAEGRIEEMSLTQALAPYDRQVEQGEYHFSVVLGGDLTLLPPARLPISGYDFTYEHVSLHRGKFEADGKTPIREPFMAVRLIQRAWGDRLPQIGTQPERPESARRIGSVSVYIPLIHR